MSSQLISSRGDGDGNEFHHRFEPSIIADAHVVMKQELNDSKYFVFREVLATVVEEDDMIRRPVVVLPHELLRDPEAIARQLQHFSAVDDVYHDWFAETAVLLVDYKSDYKSAAKRRLEKSSQFERIFHVNRNDLSKPLPSGPYFLVQGEVHQAWRLYDDHLDAFVFGTVPDDNLGFNVTSCVNDNGLFKEIAVPSRLYFEQTIEKPLAGWRVAIKDIFALQGTKVTMMSREYTSFSPWDGQTAAYVKKLIKLGAVIVGKTKMSPFACFDEPNTLTDCSCPFNPRGDGQQSPSGSSSGAAAAVAGYRWLDVSIGLDTAGGVSRPAACNGVFGLRASLDSGPLDGIRGKSPLFDSIGLLSRGLVDIEIVASLTLKVTARSANRPRKILYPVDFFPDDSPMHREMAEWFVRELEKVMGFERTNIDIAKTWAKGPPVDTKGEPFDQYIIRAAQRVRCRDFNHSPEEFRNQYGYKHGTEPYLGAGIPWRCSIGRGVGGND